MDENGNKADADIHAPILEGISPEVRGMQNTRLIISYEE